MAAQNVPQKATKIVIVPRGGNFNRPGKFNMDKQDAIPLIKELTAKVKK